MQSAQKVKKEFWGSSWKEFLAFNRRYRLILPGDRILALVSGGPDSMAMACWLSLLSKRAHFSLAILHFDHGLRPHSDREARSVKKLAGALGVPFYQEKIPVLDLAKRKRKSLEDAGRILRYRRAQAWAKKLGFNKVASAHTLDEQAESVLLNVLRGGSLKGLAGARVSRPIVDGSKIRLIRPFLGSRKADLAAYLKEAGIPYFEDPSNRDPRFLRSRIRQELLPKLEELHPKALEHLANLALESQTN